MTEARERAIAGRASAGRFDGKVAIITGASSDPSIGRSTARRLAGEGASVVLNARGAEAIAAAAQELTAAGLPAVAVSGSVLDAETQERLVDVAYDRFGRIDCIVNTVGGTTDREHIFDLQLQPLLDTIALNLGPTLGLIQAARRRGLPRGASIVNVTSPSPTKGTPTRGAYAAAKAALDAMTRTLAVSLAAEGVRVNSVRPGLTRTNYTTAFWRDDDGAAAGAREPLGRITEAHHIADGIAFLLSQDAEAITGVVLDIDMGDHLAGGWTPVTGKPGS